MQVQLWITFNEPWIITHHGYGIGIFAPGIVSPGEAIYEAGHTLLKAHAEVWHMYNDTFRAQQGGMCEVDCGVVISVINSQAMPL